MLNGIIVGTLYGIIALGVTLTFGITGIVNFALGQFMMIGAYATWYLTDIDGPALPGRGACRRSRCRRPRFLSRSGCCSASPATISSTACSFRSA